MSKADMRALLESGAHFGHQTGKWSPKMAPYIHSKRDGVHIIDLAQTVDAIDKALVTVSKVVESGQEVLFVGTKRQAQDVVEKAAADTNMPYVSVRWLGGMLTNQKTIGAQIKKLKDLEEKMQSGELAGKYNKLELQRFQEQIDEMNRMFGGIKHAQGRPGLVFVTDAIVDNLAIKEANRLGLPVVAICDTNADPSGITHVIPANDDAIKGLELITGYIIDTINAAKAKTKTVAKKDEE
jgi:small subunit ribosomal protein S2